jgi:hypothetical protein
MQLMVYTATAAMVITILTGVLPPGSPALKVVYALAVPLMAAVPLSIVVGVLQHRLYDIDVTVRRSVVYAALVVGIAGVYVVLTAAPGLAFGAQIPVEAAVLVTVVAALAFQPLRRRLERWADLRVFGARVDRYRLLTAFGSELEQTEEFTRLLPRLAHTVARGLDASWVRVSLPGVDAVVGEPAGPADSSSRSPRRAGSSAAPSRMGTTTATASCSPRSWRRRRRRSRTWLSPRSWPSGWMSCGPRGRGSSRRPTPSGGGSSATCTTACSSTSWRY